MGHLEPAEPDTDTGLLGAADRGVVAWSRALINGPRGMDGELTFDAHQRAMYAAVVAAVTPLLDQIDRLSERPDIERLVQMLEAAARLGRETAHTAGDYTDAGVAVKVLRGVG